MQINLTFLNPIEVRFHSFCYFQCLHTYHAKPQDWVKQSIPFSYMYLTANSADNASHAVQVYSDISGGTCNPFPNSDSRSPSLLRNFVTEWTSGNRSQTILWGSNSNADIAFHSVTLQAEATFKEVIDQAEWGTLYYAMKNVS